jgi:hypothetical protein
MLLIALFIRSWFVQEHIARGTNSGPAWVLRSFHGRLCLDHRSYWDFASGWTWGRRRIKFFEEPALSLYQEPTRAYGLFDIGFYSGTQYTWPGHLFPGIRTLPPQNDPRYWRDNYSTLIVPDVLLIALFAILPLIYIRRRRTARAPFTPAYKRIWPSRPLTLAAAASLLLFLFVCELSLRSYSIGHNWSRGSADGVITVRLIRGELYILRALWNPQSPGTRPYPPDNLWHHMIEHVPGFTPPPRGILHWLGFSYRNQHPWYPRFQEIALPLWPAWPLTAILPIRWGYTFYRIRRCQLRSILNQCQSCGYSLTSNTTGICSECGTPISSSPLSS